jgi:hypothetical protein
MLREGKIKLIFKSIAIEIQHRVTDIRMWIYKPKPLDDSQVPASAYVNRRKVIPPSYRPTTSQPPLTAALLVDTDIVANELRLIRSTLTFEDSGSP